MRYITWDANGRAHALRFGGYAIVWRWARLWFEIHRDDSNGEPRAIFRIGPLVGNKPFVEG